MNVASHISDLLYRYDCVIVPGFGGFITNKIGAKVNHFTHTFYPPNKQISFNSHLKHNDGLLANYIVATEQVSFEQATQQITETVVEWHKNLLNSSLRLNNIGVFSLNDAKQLVFEPVYTVNYLTSSFGLNSFSSDVITRHKKQTSSVFSVKKEVKKGIPLYIKYAATAVILLALGFVGWNGVQQQRQVEFAKKQQKELEQKIQSATFVINNPLPTLTLNVVKVAPEKFHIVAGAFQFPENAVKKLHQLKKNGFNAKIIGINKWGLTQVAFQSFTTKEKARIALKKIKQTISKDAWLFIEE